jgi:hypothetical protein
MKYDERMCNIHKAHYKHTTSIRQAHDKHTPSTRQAHATPWTKSLGQATHSIRYWGAWITHRGIHYNDDPVLDYYLLRSDADKDKFDTTTTVTECIHQLTNARRQLQDVRKDANNNGSFYEVEVSTARVETKIPT